MMNVRGSRVNKLPVNLNYFRFAVVRGVFQIFNYAEPLFKSE